MLVKNTWKSDIPIVNKFSISDLSNFPSLKNKQTNKQTKQNHQKLRIEGTQDEEGTTNSKCLRMYQKQP